MQSTERLMRLITVYAVIAWRIFYATLLSRLVPDISCTAFLQQEEWEALYCRIHHTPIPQATAPPLRQAVRCPGKPPNKWTNEQFRQGETTRNQAACLPSDNGVTAAHLFFLPVLRAGSRPEPDGIVAA